VSNFAQDDVRLWGFGGRQGQQQAQGQLQLQLQQQIPCVMTNKRTDNGKGCADGTGTSAMGGVVWG
jgi:hypothetical protein